MRERERRLARFFRAESLKSQTEIEEETGIDRGDLAHYEIGDRTPSPHHLALLARCAGLTVEGGEQILAYADSLRQPRRRPGPAAEAEALFTGPDAEDNRRAWQRFLRLRPTDPWHGTQESDDSLTEGADSLM
jgi:transcriptional regulator with XRE-family HTH domain